MIMTSRIILKCKNLEYLNHKKNGQPGGMKQSQNYKFANDKIKIEGMKSKRRVMTNSKFSWDLLTRQHKGQ